VKTLEKCERRDPDAMGIKPLSEDCIDQEEHQIPSKDVPGTVDFLLKRIHSEGDLPAFSNHMIEINTKLSSLASVNFTSSADLAKIILKDFSLTNRLLRIVNSALYAGLSGKVTTISKALFLLGIDKVRIMAATLMIFDHLESASQTKELKEIALGSIMSGLVATSVAEGMKLEGKEEVFICAMLYNLRKMLVICYCPEEYEEIKRQMARTELDETRVSQSVLGISCNDIGMAVAKLWNFPDKIVRSMEPMSRQILDQPKTELGTLRLLSGYSNELVSNLLNAPPDERTEVLSSLSKRYQKRIHIPEEQMRSLLESTVKQTHPYSDVFRREMQKSSLFNKLFQPAPDRSSAVGKTKKPIGKAGNPICPEEPAQDATLPGMADVDPKSSVQADGLREIKEVMKGSSRLNDVLYMILETMYRGLELDRVLFCLRDATKGAMAARFGLGDNIDEVVKHFNFRINRSSDLFNVVIAQAKGILIEDATSPNIVKMLPDWYRCHIAAPSFIIYPLITAKGCIGMFYGDKKSRGVLLTETDRQFMEELREIFLSAITHTGNK